uniref:histone-lysine N-methyltransferase ASH1L-like n=1 Tax=Panthera onca TaxID=9690 RepID=UPI002952B162|nr:histone-lysine N-methyltransferase ASH1L-like [Panthera onca]
MPRPLFTVPLPSQWCGVISGQLGEKGGRREGSLAVFELLGRPKGVKEQDVYICDYRLDKSAHLFYKIHRNRYPVCTKPYAFDHFPKKLTPKRDFSPHYVPDNYKRNGGRSSWKSERPKPPLKDLGQEDDALPLIEEVLASQEQAAEEMPGLEEPEREGAAAEASEGEKKAEESSPEPAPACTPEERRHSQRERLNQILLNLLDKIPGKNAIDVTYLLEEGSGRKLRRRTLFIPECSFRKHCCEAASLSPRVTPRRREGVPTRPGRPFSVGSRSYPRDLQQKQLLGPLSRWILDWESFLVQSGPSKT